MSDQSLVPTGFITNRPLALSLILGAAMAISTVAGTLVGVLGPFLRSEIGITPAGLGLLVTVFAATSGALSWPAGQLTDSIGGRRALIIVFVVSAVALLAFSMAFSYGWLVVAMVMAGIGNAAANPATNRLVATTFSPADLGLASGVKMAGVQVAVLASGLFLPQAADALGWRVPVAVSGLVVMASGVAGLLFLVGRRQSSGRSKDQAPAFHWSPYLFVLTLYSMFMSAGSSASVTYLSLYTVDDLGSTARIGGLAVAFAGTLAIAGRVALGRFTHSFRMPIRTLAFVGVLAVASVALLIAAPTAQSPLFWLAVAGLGLSALSFSAGTTVALILKMPTDQIGGSSGVMFIGFLVGFGFGPIAFGTIVEASSSYTPAWIVTGVVFALGTMIGFGAARREERVGAV